MKLIKAINLDKYIDVLTSEQDYPAISIYLNTDKRYRQNDRAKIKLKNHLKKTSDLLEKNGLNATEINTLIKPIEKITNKESFWKNLTTSTVFFSSPKNDLVIKLPSVVKTNLYIGNYFNIKHLTKYFFEKENYYVLTVSPKKNHLYKGENKNFELMPESDNLPKDIDTANWMINGEKSIQYHGTKSIDKSSRGGMTFHGHGGISDGKDIMIKRYLRMLDEHVNETIEDYTVPLVIVCTESIYTHYKDINTYKNMLSEYVSGNPDNKTTRKKLVKKAWPIVKKTIKQKKQKLFKESKDNQDLLMSDIQNVLRAAYYGSIDKLFISKIKNIWGNFDKSRVQIRFDEKRKNDSYDLMNLILHYTIKNDGEVYTLPEEEIDSKNKILALLRY